MAKKTTIRIGFDIDGVTPTDRFAKENDPALRTKATTLRDALNSASQLAAIQWPDPFQFAGQPDAYESFLKNGLSPTVSVAVLQRIKPILDELLAFSAQPYFQWILDSLLEPEQTKALVQRQYDVQFTNPSICTPCGEHCHICEVIINSAVAGSAFSPLIWIATSGGKSFSFNIRAQFRFVLENA